MDATARAADDLDAEDRRRQPILNAPLVVLIAVAGLVAVFVALRLLPQQAAVMIEWSGAVSPARFLRDVVSPRAPAAILTLATHMLFHASIVHILLNSVWLVAFGSPVARRLGPRSAAAFILLFCLSGMAGALAFVMVHPASTTILIGASGGVSGLLGALVRFAFARGSGLKNAPYSISRLTDRQILTWSAAVIGLNVVFGVFSGAFGFERANVAWEAHVGGYLFGLLAFPAFARVAAR